MESVDSQLDFNKELVDIQQCEKDIKPEDSPVLDSKDQLGSSPIVLNLEKNEPMTIGGDILWKITSLANGDSKGLGEIGIRYLSTEKRYCLDTKLVKQIFTNFYSSLLWWVKLNEKWEFDDKWNNKKLVNLMNESLEKMSVLRLNQNQKMIPSLPFGFWSWNIYLNGDNVALEFYEKNSSTFLNIIPSENEVSKSMAQFMSGLNKIITDKFTDKSPNK